MADTVTKTPSYVPGAATASERMATSVIGRIGGAPVMNSSRTQKLADRVISGYLGEPTGARREPRPSEQKTERVVAAPTRPARPVLSAEATEREGSAATTSAREEARSSSRVEMPISAPGKWEPSELSRAGVRVREPAEWTAPLFSLLPPTKLEPVLVALESALSSAAPPAQKPQPKEPASAPPSLTLLQGANAGAKKAAPGSAGDRDGAEGRAESGRISKAAMDASTRLLEALRSHAATQASLGGDRVSLGDMTTIAFADSRGQLAAATSNESSPQPKEPDKSLGNIPNPKIFSDQHSILRKIQEVANMIKKEQYKQQEHAENRFGQS